MTASLNKKKIHELIEIASPDKINAICVLLKEDLESEALRKNLILNEREAYYKGIGKNYVFEELVASIRSKKVI